MVKKSTGWSHVPMGPVDHWLKSSTHCTLLQHLIYVGKAFKFRNSELLQSIKVTYKFWCAHLTCFAIHATLYGKLIVANVTIVGLLYHNIWRQNSEIIFFAVILPQIVRFTKIVVEGSFITALQFEGCTVKSRTQNVLTPRQIVHVQSWSSRTRKCPTRFSVLAVTPQHMVQFTSTTDYSVLGRVCLLCLPL